jgi:hypothetical protein
MALACLASLNGDSSFAASKVDQFMHNLCRSLKLSKCRGGSPKSKKPAVRVVATKKPVAKPTKVAAKPPSKPRRHATRLAAARPVPIPREKPMVVAAPASSEPQPQGKSSLLRVPVAYGSPPALKPSIDAPPGADKPARPVCRLHLDALGVTFETVREDVEDVECSVENPVRLKAIKAAGGSIALPDAPLLSCAFAAKFAGWLGEAGAPIIRAQTSSPIAKLWTGPGYQCRGRNGDASGKISEHGFGNAVDITSFQLADGRTFAVADALNQNSPAFPVLKGLRGSACGYFTTVLGPGSNDDHKDHFHFDLGKHGKTDSYRICE